MCLVINVITPSLHSLVLTSQIIIFLLGESAGRSIPNFAKNADLSAANMKRMVFPTPAYGKVHLELNESPRNERFRRETGQTTFQEYLTTKLQQEATTSIPNMKDDHPRQKRSKVKKIIIKVILKTLIFIKLLFKHFVFVAKKTVIARG